MHAAADPSAPQNVPSTRDGAVAKRALHPAPGAAAGSTLVSGGVDFALWAPRAAAVELCLFDNDGAREVERLHMHGPRAAGWQGVWHGHLPNAAAGLVYGFRVHGPWAPDEGHRFNPAKVLLDPWAREVVGHYLGQQSLLAHDPADVSRPSRVDNAADALKARVVAPWPPLPRIAQRIPDDEVVLYEVHVKAATKLHPGVPEALRGTYEGLAHPAFVDHVKRLGVTTLSLLPVHQRADEPRLLKLGLTNHWGYNTVAFFAAEPRFASQREGSSPMAEFRAMVAALHDAGLEVVIDVVYNHTAEGDEEGPTFHLRGIDNTAYYHQRQHSHAHAHGSAYENWTGCGHALNLAQPRVVQLVIESLRYWAVEGGVDGFRFDLAPVLARGAQGDYSLAAGFFAAVQADPLLRGLRLIAEPWDIGPGGYRVGDFPPPWVEWNDRFRDTTRAFWLGGGASRGELAHKVAGSSRAFRKAGRSALSSVNFVTAHDGFTLRDLVSWERKHNDANGEHNRDGHGHNLSINAGVEGPSDDADVLALRARLQRALLATLAVSQGTPMLLAGDEIGHTQRGNNNAYCQDNAITWLDWGAGDSALTDFVAHALALRRELPALRSPRWHDGFGVAHDASSEADLAWYAPDGKLMTPGDWEHGRAAPLQARFDGAGGPPVLLLINPTPSECTMVLPRSPSGAWTARLRSDDVAAPAQPMPLAPTIALPPRCLWVAVASA
jgi:glycogen debranching enzyme